MRPKSMLASFAGGTIVAATTLFYAYQTLINGTREQAVNGATLIVAAAVIAVVVYEDWKDAKRNTRDRDRRNQA